MTAFIEGFGRGNNQIFTTTDPRYNRVVHKDDITSINSNFNPPINGNYCLHIDRDGPINGTIFWAKDIFGGPVTEFYVKYRFQTDRHYLNSALFVAACEDGINGSLEIQDYEGYLYLYNQINTDKLVKAPTTVSILPFKWYLIEFWLKYPDGPGTTTTGEYELRVDGILEAQSSAAWICNGTNDTYADRFIWKHGYNDNQLITDIVFDTTAAFDVHTSDTAVHLFSPNSNGTNSNWSPSSGSSYECVSVNGTIDETDTDYVISNQVGDKESYSLSTDSTGTMSLIKSIQTEHRVVREGRSNVTHVNPYLRINGSEYSGVEQPDNRAFVCQAKPIRTNWIVNPDTGLDWTESDILSLELGIESEA